MAGTLATGLRTAVGSEAAALPALCGDRGAAPGPQPEGGTTEPAAVGLDRLGGGGLTAETVAHRPEKPDLVADCSGEAGPGPLLILPGQPDTLPVGPDALWPRCLWSVSRCRMGRADRRLTGLDIGTVKAAGVGPTLADAQFANRRRIRRGRLTLLPVARRKLAAGLPLRRQGLPEAVAGAVMFLAPTTARYIAATQPVVDGGSSAV